MYLDLKLYKRIKRAIRKEKSEIRPDEELRKFAEIQSKLLGDQPNPFLV